MEKWPTNTQLSLLYPNAQVLGHEDVDFSQLDQVSNWEPPAGVKVIFNCAAYTQVDKAEEQREMALNINAEALNFGSQMRQIGNFIYSHFN